MNDIIQINNIIHNNENYNIIDNINNDELNEQIINYYQINENNYYEDDLTYIINNFFSESYENNSNFDNINRLEEIESNEICPITHEIVGLGYRTQCGHTFNRNALIRWLTSNNTCPMCRREL